MKLQGKLTTERYDTSRNGNPRYLCYINDTFFYTGVDSSHGYSITNHDGKEICVDVEYKRGKLTLTKINALDFSA